MAEVKPKLVMLFKATKEKEEDKFAKELKNNGYEAVSIPVLSFTFVNSDQLKTHLQNLSDFSAIILTSPRAVEAVVKASEAIADKGKKFSDMKCYVVGKATGALAKKAGFTTTGEDSGSATELAKVISAGPSQDGKPFLYPCSDIRRDVLVQHLKEKDLAVEEITVYETNPNDALESSVKGVLHNQGLPEFAVFFSPSGVQYTEPLVKKGLLPLDKIKVIALGPATKLEVEARGVTLHGVTAKPEPTSLVTLLKQEQVEEQKD
ncbi:uroporphyrinogen-III synthase-like [Haliotis cracherodii]|uniref:uroporphyrinogen-III synthase-like n=1 Tax=Haliotis cracherodii TaxID=6455 RepID=UPI0039EA9FB7